MVVLYCRAVDAGGKTTQRAVVWLRHRGLDSWVADILEAAGPFTTILAQLSYMAVPFLGDGLDDIARSLEQPEGLIQELREGS
ncbi:MAG: hypothetical protein IH858_02680 [Chloroflexi bacterium]|nr:hypothetical protein [Chloroflexota bacterium]MCI0854096.1 hypothetical protein [Chloroflexota bacterium]